MLKKIILSLVFTSTLVSMDSNEPLKNIRHHPYLTGVPGNVEELWSQGRHPDERYYIASECGSLETGITGKERGNSCGFLSIKESLIKMGYTHLKNKSFNVDVYKNILEEIAHFDSADAESLAQSVVFQSVVGDLLNTYQNEAADVSEYTCKKELPRNKDLDLFVKKHGIDKHFSKARAQYTETRDFKEFESYFHTVVFNIAQDYIGQKNKNESIFSQYLTIFFKNNFPLSTGGNLEFDQNGSNLPFKSMIDAIAELYFVKIQVWGQIYNMNTQENLYLEIKNLLKDELSRTEILEKNTPFKDLLRNHLVEDKDFSLKYEAFVRSLFKKGFIERYLSNPFSNESFTLLEKAREISHDAPYDWDFVLSPLDGMIKKIATFYDPKQPMLFLDVSNKENPLIEIQKNHQHKDISAQTFLMASVNAYINMYQKMNICLKSVKPSVFEKDISVFFDGGFHWKALLETDKYTMLDYKKTFSDESKRFHMHEYAETLFLKILVDPDYTSINEQQEEKKEKIIVEDKK